MLSGRGVATLIPERHPSLTVRPARPLAAGGGGLRAPLRLVHGPDAARAEADAARPGRFRGVLTLQRDGAPVHVTVDLPLPRRAHTETGTDTRAGTETGTDTRAGTETVSAPIGLAFALLLAFLGGLILNLMPCVLPVLAVKLVGLVALGGGDTRAGRQAARGYVLGVVASLLTLGGAVALRAALGRAVGWGFQLQEPIAVALLMATVVAFALHLFGVWRVGVPRGASRSAPSGPPGLWRSAAEGVLAVVLATPCSAPFLGTAVGFALAAGPGTIRLVFAVLGRGLAAPFALAATVPAVRRRLPRPGPWMLSLEIALGFALLATGIWLAWVLVRLAGADGLVRGLVFALATAAVAVVLGRTDRRGIRLAAMLALLPVAAGLLRFEPPETRAQPAAGWQPWSPDAVRAAQAAGETVFVDFTADWCITCKANERLVLDDPEVDAALARGARFVADWTRRDERIRAALAEHGKGGVPLYLVYRPGVASPQVLPEILTKERVLAALAP